MLSERPISQLSYAGTGGSLGELGIPSFACSNIPVRLHLFVPIDSIFLPRATSATLWYDLFERFSVSRPGLDEVAPESNYLKVSGIFRAVM